MVFIFIAIPYLCLLLICISLFVFNSRLRKVTLITPANPALLKNDQTCQSFVETHCPSLLAGFKSSWWLPNGHAQTIYSAIADFSMDDHVVYQRHLLGVPDGGTVGIDIYPSLSVPLDQRSPVVIVNHGLTGGSHESYVRSIVLWIAKPWAEGGLGGRAVVVNFRGCANTPLTSPHLYCSGTTLDTHVATLYISSLLPMSPLLGIGFSLGAAVMTRFLGEQGDQCRLNAAAVLCCPLELKGMSARLDSVHLFPRLYSLIMARKMLRSVGPHLRPSLPLSSPNSALHPVLSDILDLTTRYRWSLRASQVTELIVSKVGGSSSHFPFEGLNQFLEWACPGGWIGQIKRPTLAISALDDPIVSGDCLPYEAVRDSTHFVLATVPHGGHLGWFDGPLTGPRRHSRWYTKPIIDFLRGATKELCSTLPPVEFSQHGEWSWVGDVGWRVIDKQDESGWE